MPVNIGHGIVHPGIWYVIPGGPCDSLSTSTETVMLAQLALPWLLGALIGATLYPAGPEDGIAPSSLCHE
jgi:hypothetical protein